jgi:hypothetical protein
VASNHIRWRARGIKGNEGGALRVGDDVFAGARRKRLQTQRRRRLGSGHEAAARQGTSQIDRSQVNRGLDREYSARSRGSWQSGAARSGGYHGGYRGGYGGARRGGGRRR